MAGTKHTPYSTGGGMLRKRREVHANWQEQSRFAVDAGVPAPLYRNWEAGYRRPSPELFYPVAALLFDNPSDASACAEAFGIKFDGQRWTEALRQRNQVPAQLASNKRSGSGVLRGSAVEALLNGYKGTIRRGLPTLEGQRPWMIKRGDGKKVVDPRVLRTVSDGLSLALRPEDLQHDSYQLKLANLDVYLVGDDSFAEYNCHRDTLLIVCPGCYKHDGRLLIEHKGTPYLIPHFKGRSAEEVAVVLGDDFGGYKPLGAVLAAVKYREQSIREQPIFLNKNDPLLGGSGVSINTTTPVGGWRIGIPPWPDTLLLAYDVFRKKVPNELALVEFVVRESFAQLRTDFEAGMLDVLLGPPELWGSLASATKVQGSDEVPPLVYRYIGNALYVSERTGDSPPELRKQLYPQKDAHGLPTVENAKKLLQGRSIATYKANDDHCLLVRYLRAIVEQNADLLGAQAIDFEAGQKQVETALGVKITTVEGQDRPSADFLWWAVTVPKDDYLPEPITIVEEGASPVTAVHVFCQASMPRAVKDAFQKLFTEALDRPNPSGEYNAWREYRVNAMRYLRQRLSEKLPGNFSRVIEAIKPASDQKQQGQRRRRGERGRP